MKKRSKETVWLQYADYENGECVMHDFEVLAQWLKEKIKMPLEKFMDRYISMDAEKLHKLAKAQGKILAEKISR